jgi:uncharacterized repeat protein (TIGR03803 family)
MKIRLGRLAAFVLVSLSSLLGLAARAGAQPSEELNGLPILGKQAETPNQAKNAGGSGYGVLYSFCSAVQGSDCTDGEFPASSLIQDAAGNLYGTTAEGGNVNSNCYGGSCGTVFKLDDTGHQTVLYAFCSNGGTCADGQQPDGGLIQDAAGNLYGTTLIGGANSRANNGSGGGTIFKLPTGSRKAIVTPTSSSSPAQVDQPVTFSVVVSGRGPTPTGSVRFDEGKTTLGIVALVNGQASLTTTFRKIGSFSIVVSYSGDQNFKSAYAGPLTHVIM